MTSKHFCVRALRRNVTRIFHNGLFLGGVLSLLIQLQYQLVRLLGGILLARIMGPVQLGIYSFTLALVTLFQIVPAYGLDGVVIRYSAQYGTQKSWDLLRGLWQIAFIASIGYGLLSVGAMFGIISLGWLNVAAAYSPRTLEFAAILMLCMPTLTYLSASLRAINPGVLGQLPQFTIQPGIFLVLVLIVTYAMRHAMNAPEAMCTQGLAAAAAVAVAAGWLRRHQPNSLRDARPRRELGRWINSATSFWLLGGLELINTQADLLMLGTFGTANETGLYRVAANGANLLALSAAAINAYIGPKIPGMYTRQDFGRLQRILKLCARGAFALSLLGACVFWLWGRNLLTLVFGAAYLGAFWPLAILCFGQLSSLGSGFGGLLLSMTGHEREAAVIAGGAAVCNIALNVMLIPRFGATGTAVATAVSIFIWRGMLSFVVRKRTGLNISIFPSAAS